VSAPSPVAPGVDYIDLFGGGADCPCFGAKQAAEAARRPQGSEVRNLAKVVVPANFLNLTLKQAFFRPEFSRQGALLINLKFLRSFTTSRVDVRRPSLFTFTTGPWQSGNRHLGQTAPTWQPAYNTTLPRKLGAQMKQRRLNLAQRQFVQNKPNSTNE